MPARSFRLGLDAARPPDSFRIVGDSGPCYGRRVASGSQLAATTVGTADTTMPLCESFTEMSPPTSNRLDAVPIAPTTSQIPDSVYDQNCWPYSGPVNPVSDFFIGKLNAHRKITAVSEYFSEELPRYYTEELPLIAAEDLAAIKSGQFPEIDANIDYAGGGKKALLLGAIGSLRFNGASVVGRKASEAIPSSFAHGRTLAGRDLVDDLAFKARLASPDPAMALLKLKEIAMGTDVPQAMYAATKLFTIGRIAELKQVLRAVNTNQAVRDHVVVVARTYVDSSKRNGVRAAAAQGTKAAKQAEKLKTP